METIVIDNEDGQLVIIPEGCELPFGFKIAGDEATVRREGEALILTPTPRSGAEDHARLINV